MRDRSVKSCCAKPAPSLPELGESLTCEPLLRDRPPEVGLEKELLSTALSCYELIREEYASLRRIASMNPAAAPRARNYLQEEVHGALLQVERHLDNWKSCVMFDISVSGAIVTDELTPYLCDIVEVRLARTRRAIQQAQVTCCPVGELTMPSQLPPDGTALSRLPMPPELTSSHSFESRLLLTAMRCFELLRRQHHRMLERQAPAVRFEAGEYLVTDLRSALSWVENRHTAWIDSQYEDALAEQHLFPADELARSLAHNKSLISTQRPLAQPGLPASTETRSRTLPHGPCRSEPAGAPPPAQAVDFGNSLHKTVGSVLTNIMTRARALPAHLAGLPRAPGRRNDGEAPQTSET